MKKIITLLTAVILVSGCAIFKPYKDLSPEEKAIVSVETLSSWYYNTHRELEIKYATGTPEEKQYLAENVNPKMNALRPLIIKYDKLVSLWVETNAQPENLTALVTEIHRLVLDVIEALQ